MPRPTQNLVRKVWKMHPNQQEMLDTFTQKWGFISESEVMRQALSFFYRKWEPEYLQPSSREKDRENAAKEAAKIKNMSDEDYATTVLKGLIKTAKDGTKFVFVWTLGNSIRGVPLKDVKQFAMAEEGWYLKFNLGELNKGKSLQTYWEKYKRDWIARFKLEDESAPEAKPDSKPEVPDETKTQAQIDAENGDKIAGDLLKKFDNLNPDGPKE